MHEDIVKEKTDEKKHTPHKDKKRTRKIIIIVSLTLIILGVIVFFLFSERMKATTMSLTDYNGTVILSDKRGTELEIWKDRQLADGNTLKTAEESKAFVMLDKDRLVTLMQKSAADFHQSKRTMTLSLTEGRLFFNIIKALEDDENLDIHTSNVTLSIRGTSGYVDADENGSEVLYLTSGNIHFTATSPVTGESEENDVHAGQKLTVTLLPDGSLEIKIEDIPRNALPHEAEEMISSDPALLSVVLAETGWSEESPASDVAGEEPEKWPILRSAETVVDGITHHAYYEVPMDEGLNDWLDKLIAACETQNKDEALALCGSEGQNLNMIANVSQEAEKLRNAYPDIWSDLSLLNIWHKGYRCCISLGYENEHDFVCNVYLIPDNGMGYFVGAFKGTYQNEEAEWPYEGNSFGSCECKDGMFNGRLIGTTYNAGANSNGDWIFNTSEEMNITNGLREGLCEIKDNAQYPGLGRFNDEIRTDQYERGRLTKRHVKRTYGYSERPESNEYEEFDQKDEDMESLKKSVYYVNGVIKDGQINGSDIYPY